MCVTLDSKSEISSNDKNVNEIIDKRYARLESAAMKIMYIKQRPFNLQVSTYIWLSKEL